MNKLNYNEKITVLLFYSFHSFVNLETFLESFNIKNGNTVFILKKIKKYLRMKKYSIDINKLSALLRAGVVWELSRA